MNRREVLKSSSLFFGYAVSASALSSLFTSCSNEKTIDWKPVFFDNHQALTVAEITECILPKTSTPGAKDLKIDRFVDTMLKDLLTDEEQKDFIKGLESLDDACKEQQGKNFIECTPEQQKAFLLKLDKESKKLPPSVWGIRLSAPSPTPFYRRLKELTLLGYFTSKEIGEKVLGFDPLPGGFIACMPLTPGMKAWNE